MNTPAPRLSTKTDIINYLADARGYRSYLELCTSVTGNCYAAVEHSKFEVCHRLMYRCPDDFDDGLKIDFRSTDLDVTECVRQIELDARRYDVVLVDGFHFYETASRDLALALDLLAVGGTIVVHDCLPPTAAAASPERVDGDWCGVTYKAYVDLVTARRDLDYCTVDTDYGCGIVRKREGDDAPASPASPDDSDVVRAWRDLGDDYAATFRFLQAHKTELLKLVAVDELLRSNPKPRL
jgi:hypothetical protein